MSCDPERYCDLCDKRIPSGETAAHCSGFLLLCLVCFWAPGGLHARPAMSAATCGPVDIDADGRPLAPPA